MKDHDLDIQVFNHSARKERGSVPSPLACFCNVKVWLGFHEAEREQYLDLIYTGTHSSIIQSHLNSIMEMSFFWWLLKICTELMGLCLCIYLVTLAGSAKALLFLSKVEWISNCLFSVSSWQVALACFSARFDAADPRSYLETPLVAAGEGWHVSNEGMSYSESPECRLLSALYVHVEVLLCLLYVILDFWSDVKPQLLGHWQRNHRWSHQFRFLPAQRNDYI